MKNLQVKFYKYMSFCWKKRLFHHHSEHLTASKVLYIKMKKESNFLAFLKKKKIAVLSPFCFKPPRNFVQRRWIVALGVLLGITITIPYSLFLSSDFVAILIIFIKEKLICYLK